MGIPASVYAQLDEVEQRVVSIRQSLTSHDETEHAPDPNPPTDEWPAAGSWSEKIAWIQRQPGPKTSLTLVTAANPPAGCRVDGGILWVEDADLLEGIRFDGQIRPDGPNTGPITLRNVQAHDVFAAGTQARVVLVEDCAFTIPAARVASGWGQGCLNAMAPGFTVSRTIMQGGADGMQCGGGGTIEDSVIRSLTFTSTTHNDFVQNYGGQVYVRRTYMEQLNAPTNHLNGLFCDGGWYDVEDTAIVVTAPTGTNAWALHAGKYVTQDQIVARRCYLRGRKIEKVPGAIKFQADVDWAAGY